MKNPTLTKNYHPGYVQFAQNNHKPKRKSGGGGARYMLLACPSFSLKKKFIKTSSYYTFSGNDEICYYQKEKTIKTTR